MLHFLNTDFRKISHCKNLKMHGQTPSELFLLNIEKCMDLYYFF